MDSLRAGFCLVLDTYRNVDAISPFGQFRLDMHHRQLFFGKEPSRSPKVLTLDRDDENLRAAGVHLHGFHFRRQDAGMSPEEEEERDEQSSRGQASEKSDDGRQPAPRRRRGGMEDRFERLDERRAAGIAL